jgi:hypothetical protein
MQHMPISIGNLIQPQNDCIEPAGNTKRVGGWTAADGGRHGGSRRGNVEGYRRLVVPELRADLDALHQVERGVGGVGVARA